MILQIIEMDEVILRTKASKVTVPLSDDTKAFIADLFDTVRNASGYGLAAPQVNRHERVFVVNSGFLSQAFINPIITKRWGKVSGAREGCLSLPGVEVVVPRHKFIKIDYTDENGVRHTNKKFRGHDARVIQHEYDHLDGILIVDYAKTHSIGGI